MHKKTKKMIVAVIAISMIAMYGFIPVTKAASLTGASDTITDSDLSATANHTIAFTTQVVLVATDYFEVAFDSNFGDIADIADITCPAGGVAATSSPKTARCTFAGGLAATTTVVTINNITNPASANSYAITVTTYDQSGPTERESATPRVAIIDDVQVSAVVPTTLQFAIAGLATTTDVNGDATTGSSTETALDFGTLVIDTPVRLGQQLSVVTNANNGYSVTVEQSANLTNGGSADIDSFVDGIGSTTAVTWVAPSATLDTEATYGHFGLTSEDATLSDGDHFSAQNYQGFISTTPVEVMYHGGPADGSTVDKGLTEVGYQIEISALQEAGDYSNFLTYICTPTY